MTETLNDLLEDFEKKAVLVEKVDAEIKKSAKKLSDSLKKEKNDNDKIMDKFKKFETIESKIVKLNVGGTLFSTMRSTLIKKIKDEETGNFYQPSIFEGELFKIYIIYYIIFLFLKHCTFLKGYIEIKYDENKAIFIDRNPKHFGYILDYLRMANNENEFELTPSVDRDDLIKEGKFYNLRGLEILTPKRIFDSKILNDLLITGLLKVCQFQSGKQFQLLYRATRDGFAASSFHSKCDNIPKTITVVKSRNGNIFGGYTYVCWDQSGDYKTDNNAFIFSLINLQNSPIKIACSPGQNSIFCHSSYGPTFGNPDGLDLYIANNPNSNNQSYSNLTYSYMHPNYYNNPNYYQYLLAGAYNFYVDEIEVFNAYKFCLLHLLKIINMK